MNGDDGVLGTDPPRGAQVQRWTGIAGLVVAAVGFLALFLPFASSEPGSSTATLWDIGGFRSTFSLTQGFLLFAIAGAALLADRWWKEAGATLAFTAPWLGLHAFSAVLLEPSDISYEIAAYGLIAVELAIIPFLLAVAYLWRLPAVDRRSTPSYAQPALAAVAVAVMAYGWFQPIQEVSGDGPNAGISLESLLAWDNGDVGGFVYRYQNFLFTTILVGACAFLIGRLVATGAGSGFLKPIAAGALAPFWIGATLATLLQLVARYVVPSSIATGFGEPIETEVALKGALLLVGAALFFLLAARAASQSDDGDELAEPEDLDQGEPVGAEGLEPPTGSAP